ncbi:MAG: hypothetical protein EOO44_20795 [Flavobacterium sp.]|nr:MAG: hypothetical protein EOO44_20795 [Flavobacterium sp.]
MSTEFLTDLFGRGSDVKNIMSELQELNFIIKVSGSYIKHAATYKLNDTIATENVFNHNFCASDSALIKRLEENIIDVKSSIDQLKMLRNYVKVSTEGKDYLLKKYNAENELDFATDHSDYGLKAIYDQRYFSTRPDIKSRVYTNLTSLSRNHRKYVEIDRKPMLMTDINNSQILLTVPLIHKHWAKISGIGLFNLPEDIRNFQKLAESGKFYEAIAKTVGMNFLSYDMRSEFKNKVFAEIWFSKNSKRMTAIKKAFKKEFPNVFDIIWKLKEKKHNEFAIKLQRFEASILVDKVWKKMFKLGKVVFTLHDAIICNNLADLEFAEKLISDELAKHWITPMFKREQNEEIIFSVAA